MASLSYADEHFAWQQRVGKEIGSKNNFFDTHYRSSSMGNTLANRSGQSFNPTHTMSSTFNREQKRYKNEGFNHAYAFGGKTNIGHATPKAADNPLLARPSTQGSYQSKASSRRSDVLQKAAQVKTQGPRRNLAKELEKEQVSFGKQGARINRFNEQVEYRQPSAASSRRSQVSHPQDVEGQMVVDTKPFETQDEVEGVDVEGEEGEIIDPILSRPESMRSEKTTQSQREYIEMLELLLKEERDRRQNAEKELAKRDG